MRLSVQAKFLFFSVLILATVLGLAFTFLYRQALATVTTKFSNDFKAGRVAALSLLDHRLRSLGDKVQVISRAPHIQPLLADAEVDYASIQFTFADVQESLAADPLIVTNDEGRVRYWAGRPAASGQSVRQWPIVEETLKIKRTWGVQVIDSALVMLAAVPVYSTEQRALTAVLLAGQVIDETIVDDIRRISSMEVVFTHSTRIRASSLLTHQQGLLEASLSAESLVEDHVEDVMIQGVTYRCGFASLPGEKGVGILLLSSLDAALYENLAPIKRHIAIAAVIGLVLSVIASFLAARSQTEPIRSLVEGTKAVERGDYQHRIRVVQTFPDELGDLSQSFNEMIGDLEEKQKMESVLHMGLGKEIAEAMLKSGALGGEERKVTMQFSDLRGFTALSEKLTPTQVISMLNEYMTRMSVCIDEEGGVVDKFVGDEIMALFGAPVAHPDDAERAVRSGIKMRAALKKFNEERAQRGDFDIRMGMGINTGRVVAGNMGSESRRNYTVIGAACNLAARLCSNAAAAQILISDSTYHEVKDVFQTKKLDPIRVKNVADPVQIYEIL